MNEKEIAIISRAMASADPQEEVNKSCREILALRLQWDQQPDRKLRFLLENIVKELNFPLRYSIVGNMPGPDRDLIRTADSKELLGYGAAVITGLCAATSKNAFLSLLGGTLSAVGGYGLCRTLSSAAIDRLELKVITTPREIVESMDQAYQALTSLYSYRQLEGRNIKILNWFQHLYAEDSSEKMHADLSRLLGQYGYSFVDFTPERSADFEISNGNVEKPLTTEPAICNEKGTVVCKGTAVIPGLKN